MPLGKLFGVLINFRIEEFFFANYFLSLLYDFANSLPNLWIFVKILIPIFVEIDLFSGFYLVRCFLIELTWRDRRSCKCFIKNRNILNPWIQMRSFRSYLGTHTLLWRNPISKMLSNLLIFVKLHNCRLWSINGYHICAHVPRPTSIFNGASSTARGHRKRWLSLNRSILPVMQTLFGRVLHWLRNIVNGTLNGVASKVLSISFEVLNLAFLHDNRNFIWIADVFGVH